MEIAIINGGIAQDDRGSIRFVNDFDMQQVRRFYIIKNADNELIRGWRGHRIEDRWFYVLSGSFCLDIVKIDDWEKASRDLPVAEKTLSCRDRSVLHIPRGHATAFRALEENSELLVFANFSIEHAVLDDHTWAVDYFSNKPDSFEKFGSS